jgi:hypothetical protein
VLKLRYVPLSLPKLYFVPVNELLGVFLSGVIVGTHKLDRSDKMTVPANDVRSVLCQFRHPQRPEWNTDKRPRLCTASIGFHIGTQHTTLPMSVHLCTQ